MTEPDFLLDTDVLIEILRGSLNARRWLESVGEGQPGISVLTRMEILQGARDRREQEMMITQLDGYHLVLLESNDSRLALRWFESYRLSHGVGIIDCLIAASTRRLEKPLYTFNRRHYQIIPELDAREPYER